MTRKTLTIAALLVATIATGAAAPTFAQNNAANDRPQAQHLRGGDGDALRMRHGGQRDGMRMRRGGGMILAMVCSEKGADRLEHMLLNVEQRTDPTADQQPLFDTFKATALQAQTDFAATCASARPDAETAADTDLVERLGAHLEMQQAHLDAMSAVLPDFEAFYDSLSDEQKQAMEFRRGRGEGQRHGDRRGKHRNAPAMAAPEAPADQS